MNPIDLHEAVNRFLQWDIDRIAALIAGLLIGAGIGWFLLRHLRAQVKELKSENRQFTRDVRELEDKVHQFREENHSLKDGIRESARKQKDLEGGADSEFAGKLKVIRQQLEKLNKNASEQDQEVDRRKHEAEAKRKIEAIRARLRENNSSEGNTNG